MYRVAQTIRAAFEAYLDRWLVIQVQQSGRGAPVYARPASSQRGFTMVCERCAQKRKGLAGR